MYDGCQEMEKAHMAFDNTTRSSQHNQFKSSKKKTHIEIKCKINFYICPKHAKFHNLGPFFK